MARPSPAPAPILEYKQQLKEGQAALCATYLENGDAQALLKARCRLVDDLLRQLWRDQGFPDSVDLVAVGGYGRGNSTPPPTSTCSFSCPVRRMRNWPIVWNPSSAFSGTLVWKSATASAP